MTLLLLARQAMAVPYEESVHVTARVPATVREGVVRVRVVDETGAFVGDLAARDFALNRGTVEVTVVAHAQLPPALVLLVDLTVAPWSDRSGASGVTTPQLARAVVERLAKQWPDGRTCVAFLAGDHVARLQVDVPEGPALFPTNRELAELLARRPDALEQPLVALPTLRDRHLHGRVADLLAGLGAPELQGYEHLAALVTNAWEGDAFRAYRVVCSGMPPECYLWATEMRRAGEARVSSAAMTDRVAPFVVQAPWSKRITSDMVMRGGMVWGTAPAVDAERWMLLAKSLEGRRSLAEKRAAGGAVDDLVAWMHERTECWFLAWRTPAEARLGETFVKVDVLRNGARAVPDRVGAQRLLSADPYEAPWLGPLDEAPAWLRALAWEPGPPR